MHVREPRRTLIGPGAQKSPQRAEAHSSIFAALRRTHKRLPDTDTLMASVSGWLSTNQRSTSTTSAKSVASPRCAPRTISRSGRSDCSQSHRVHASACGPRGLLKERARRRLIPVAPHLRQRELGDRRARPSSGRTCVPHRGSVRRCGSRCGRIGLAIGASRGGRHGLPKPALGRYRAPCRCRSRAGIDGSAGATKLELDSSGIPDTDACGARSQRKEFVNDPSQIASRATGHQASTVRTRTRRSCSRPR